MSATAVIMPSGEVLGGFRVGDVIGVGGMAVVYRARQLSLNREVALKVLSLDLGTDELFLERFRREGMHVAQLDHPNIIPIYDAGEDRGRLFLAMRMVDGMTLAEHIRADPLTASESLELLAPIADALDAAHAIGLVHRDIKPQNILVTDAGHPYLADFGVAKGVGSAGLTASGGFVGTLHYAAPEQILGTATVPETDIYALTAVLYHCLTGTVPYPRDTEAGVIFAQVNQPPPQLALPGTDQLNAVLARGMAKQAEDRYRSAGDLIAAAEGAVRNLPSEFRTRRPGFAFSPATGAWEERLTTDASPAQATPPRRASTRLNRRSAIGLLAGLVILAAAFVAIALSGPTAAASLRTTRSGPLAIRYTPAWRPTSDAFGAAVLTPGHRSGAAFPVELASGAVTLSAGAVVQSAAVPAGVPPRLKSELGAPVRSVTDLAGGEAAARYRWTFSGGRDFSALVIPTVRGDLAIICSAPIGANAAMRACETMASRAQVNGVALMGVGRDAGLAGSLKRILTGRPNGHHALAAMYSTHGAGPGPAPRNLARSDARAALKLSKQAVPERYRAIVSGLQAGLRAESRALIALAGAAAETNRTAYAGASAAIEKAGQKLASLSREAQHEDLLTRALAPISVPNLPSSTNSSSSGSPTIGTVVTSGGSGTPQTDSPSSSQPAAGSTTGTTSSSSSKTGHSGPVHG